MCFMIHCSGGIRPPAGLGGQLLPQRFPTEVARERRLDQLPAAQDGTADRREAHPAGRLAARQIPVLDGPSSHPQGL